MPFQWRNCHDSEISRQTVKKSSRTVFCANTKNCNGKSATVKSELKTASNDEDEMTFDRDIDNNLRFLRQFPRVIENSESDKTKNWRAFEECCPRLTVMIVRVKNEIQAYGLHERNHFRSDRFQLRQRKKKCKEKSEFFTCESFDWPYFRARKLTRN